MQAPHFFKDKTLMITGGTGSLPRSVFFQGMRKSRTICATACRLRTLPLHAR